MPHLFKSFDESFTERVLEGDVLVAGANFVCGCSREHPAVGLAHAGVKAVICKSVNRINCRSSVNQGLPIIIVPEVVDVYKAGDQVDVELDRGVVLVNGKPFHFSPLLEKLMNIFQSKGLVNYIRLYA